MDLDQVLIVGIIFLAIYKVVEVFVHRKERINLVEKIDLTQDNKANISQILGDNASNKNWGLRIGCLLVGIGLGIIVAYLIISTRGLYIESSEEAARRFWGVIDQISIIYTSCAMLFGGASLLASYWIEKKQIKK